MDCSCSAHSGYDDDEHSWGKRIVKAAKEHKCYECHGAIHKHEEYHYHTVFSPGTIDNFKVCRTCQNVIDQFFPNGWMFGSIWDDLRSYIDSSWIDDLPSDCISKLVPAARDKVCDILQEYQR